VISYASSLIKSNKYLCSFNMEQAEGHMVANTGRGMNLRAVSKDSVSVHSKQLMEFL
jgi:repressor of nif and glnA expression